MVVSVTVQVVQHLARQWAAAKRQASVAGQVPFRGLIRRLRKHIWWMDSRRSVPKDLMRICISLGKLAFSNNFHKLMMGQLGLGRREIEVGKATRPGRPPSHLTFRLRQISQAMFTFKRFLRLTSRP